MLLFCFYSVPTFNIFRWRTNISSQNQDFKLNLPEEGNLSPSHCCQFDTIASSSCPEPGKASQVSGRAPEGQNKGTPTSKSALSGAQFKCLYASAHSMGNKQKELDM